MSSYGQNLLHAYLETMLNLKAVQDVRPEWLGGLELDIYFEAENFAVEFQGDQHFLPIYGEVLLRNQWSNDRVKREICKSRGVALMKVDASELEWTRLRGKLKRYFFLPEKQDRKRLKKLNQLASGYRAMLKERYGSMTAHRSSKGCRNKARRRWFEARAEPK